MWHREFGVPKGVAPPPDYLKVGYTFKDYDKSSRFYVAFPPRCDGGTGAAAS